ncbi:MAG: DsrE family protein [Bacteroidota bacterium]
MSILILINDAPYGTEKAYNALRLAMTLQKDHPTVQVKVFLMADAVSCGIPNQNTPQGYYNIERMLKSVLAKGGKVKACGTCADARGMRNIQLIEGVEISNIAELAEWTVEADKVFTF